MLWAAMKGVSDGALKTQLQWGPVVCVSVHLDSIE